MRNFFHLLNYLELVLFFWAGWQIGKGERAYGKGLFIGAVVLTAGITVIELYLGMPLW